MAVPVRVFVGLGSLDLVAVPEGATLLLPVEVPDGATVKDAV